MGVPTGRYDGKIVVEVTDSNVTARAKLRPTSRSSDNKSLVWVDEHGRALSWQPTHWRVPPAPSDPIFEVD